MLFQLFWILFVEVRVILILKSEVGVTCSTIVMKAEALMFYLYSIIPRMSFHHKLSSPNRASIF